MSVGRAGIVRTGGRAARLGAAFRDQRDLLENALSLGGTTATTTILGIAYWSVAARFLSPTSIGFGSAGLSAVSLLATFGVVGFGSLLLGTTAAAERNRGGLVAAGLAVAGAVSAVLAIVYGAVVTGFAHGFAPYAAGRPEMLLFGAAAAFTGASFVLDNALVALFLGNVQLLRNVVFGVAKLGAIAMLAVLAADGRGIDVVASWLVGNVVSFGVVAVVLTRRGRRVVHRPRLGDAGGTARSALLHHWLNLATYGPRTALPLLATATLSARTAGTLYPAWLLASTIYLIPGHLSTSLFAVGAARPQLFGRKTRTSLKVSLAVGVPVSLAVAAAGRPLLWVFGASYAQAATLPLALLLLGYVPNVIRFHYATVRRVEERLRDASVAMTALAVVEIGAAAAGGVLGGTTGLALGLTAAMWLEGIVLVRPVIGVARRSAGQGSS